MGLIRRTVSFLSVMLLVLAGGWLIASPASAAPQTAAVGGITYSYDDADSSLGATAEGLDGSSPALTEVDIPATVTIGGDDYDVVGIAEDAFRSESLTSLTVGDNVTTIGDFAFKYNDLESLDLGDSVATIGKDAFAYNDLTSLDLPNTVTEISYRSFGYNKFDSLELSDSVTSIGVLAFSYNNELTEVVLGNSVGSIGNFAFGDSPNLKSVVFTGEAPTSINPGGNLGESFDTASGELMLTYRWVFGDPQTPGGFTSPTWEGYDTQAIATVDFDLNSHGTTTPGDQYVIVGKTATEPTPEPAASGYVFTGWYTDAGASDAFDFSAEIDGDTTLYAGWETAEIPDDEDTAGDTDGDETGGSDKTAHPTVAPASGL